MTVAAPKWVRFFVSSLSLFAATDPLAVSTQKKFDQISAGKLRSGTVVVFTPAELNAWARQKVPESIPQGLRNPVIELGSGEATGSALVDFLKMRSGQGKDTGWLMAKLIEGERPLKVWIRMSSSGGRATVFLTRVDLSNATLSGRTLDFLIDNFFRPLYPEARIDQPFDLEFSMERIEIQPTGVRVLIKR
jgi:hypothetical protein